MAQFMLLIRGGDGEERSPAEARNRMFATANRMFGTAIAATTITTNTTIKISIRLNPPVRSRRR